MTTNRTFSGTAGMLDLRLPVGRARVTVTPDTTRIAVTLSTPDDTGPSVEAIGNTVESYDAGRFWVRVPDIAADIIGGSGSSQVVNNGGGTVFNNFHGGIHVGRSVQVVNGTITGIYINGDNLDFGHSPQAVSAQPINAEVLLPVGCALSIHGTAVIADITGHLTGLQANTVSGRIRAASVAELVAETTSGDIDAEVVLGSVMARTVSGDIVIGSYHGPEARISTVSGDVRLGAGAGARGTLNVKTVSGDLDLRGTGRLAVSASTVSGHERIA